MVRLGRGLYVAHVVLLSELSSLLEEYFPVFFEIELRAYQNRDDPVSCVVLDPDDPVWEILEALPVGQVENEDGSDRVPEEEGPYRLELLLASSVHDVQLHNGIASHDGLWSKLDAYGRRDVHVKLLSGVSGQQTGLPG